MAVRERSAAPKIGHDFFAVLVDLRDDQLEIKDRESGEPKEVEIIRFSFCVDTEGAGYWDLEATAWGDTGRAPSWSDRSFAGKVYKAAMRQQIPETFDDQELLFRPFFVTLKEQRNQGNTYLAIDEVKAIPAQLFKGAAGEAIKGQVDELLAAARSGKKVIPDTRENRGARDNQAAAVRGSSIPGDNNGSQGSSETQTEDLEEFEDIPF